MYWDISKPFSVSEWGIFKFNPPNDAPYVFPKIDFTISNSYGNSVNLANDRFPLLGDYTITPILIPGSYARKVGERWDGTSIYETYEWLWPSTFNPPVLSYEVRIFQTISSISLTSVKLPTAAPFTVSAPTASSGLPVTLSVLSGPATISGTPGGTYTVTLTGAEGTVVIAADQAGMQRMLRSASPPASRWPVSVWQSRSRVSSPLTPALPTP